MSSKSDMFGDGAKLRKLGAQRRKRIRKMGLIFAIPLLGGIGVVATHVVINLINMGF